jgi:8-oxo-dGTP pyrophosphatase MutT (NUDIX family)
MKTRPFWFYRQSGVIAYRMKDGAPEILLVTSRNRSRWVIPKGVVEIGMSPVESATKEAYEEAGVRGEASAEAIGSYEYTKWNGVCIVEVFLLHITELLDEWPEEGERERRWVAAEEAVEVLQEEGLKGLIRKVSPMLLSE